MRRPIFAVLAILALALPLGAQGPAGGATPGQGGAKGPAAAGQGGAGWRRDVKDLDLKPAEIKAIQAILDRQEDQLATATSEMKIVQARLERLLLDKEPDLEAIRQLVKSSLDWELKARMVRIERAIELRKLLGTDRWARLQKLQREYLLAKRSGKLKTGDFGENADSLLGLLDRLE